ncbi:hypothetical protein [Niallia taxi]|uniref:hypothetical protein n=1 Tax=Niallia taxi TaxID=2499688 RepID=UPI0021754C52|nr:hypothetical protein [Niallia taxi]
MDVFIYIMFGLFLVTGALLYVAKKRMDNNEPLLGWQRKQYLEEMAESNNGPAAPKMNQKVKRSDLKRLTDLWGIEDIKYGIFHKEKNEYAVIISADFVNFDLLEPMTQQGIILGYQGLFRVIRFPVQILGQAVRQDLRKDVSRWRDNLKNTNAQCVDYNEQVINHIQNRSEREFQIKRKVYYVVPYIYQPSKFGKLTDKEREKRILEELQMRVYTVVSMLNKAQINAEVLDSLRAMEVMKRALNRDRIISTPIEDVFEKGKLSDFVGVDVTSLPGFERLVNDVEEVTGQNA